MSRPSLLRQTSAPLLRLGGGLWKGSGPGRLDFRGDEIQLAVWDGDRGAAVSAPELALRPDPSGWLGCLLRFTVGPKETPKRGGSRWNRFDADLLFTVEELEALGAGMVTYTLGALADQPDVDLNGDPCAKNVIEGLLGLPEGELTGLQRARRSKIMRLFFE